MDTMHMTLKFNVLLQLVISFTPIITKVTKVTLKRFCNTSCVYFKLRINLNVHRQYVILRIANRNPSKAAAAM